VSKAVFPGSFDPITKGHINVIERAAKIFDHVVVCVMVNYKKKYVFTEEERRGFVQESINHLKNVEVMCSDEMLVNFAQKNHCNVIIKGLRTTQDFEYEMQMALTNKVLAKDIETFFMMTGHRYSYLSSSVVREVMTFDGDVSEFVPPHVEKALKEKYRKDDCE